MSYRRILRCGPCSSSILSAFWVLAERRSCASLLAERPEPPELAWSIGTDCVFRWCYFGMIVSKH